MQNPLIHCSLTALLASDLERSQAFYRDVLGCHEANEYWVIRDSLKGMALKVMQAASPEDVRPRAAASGYPFAFDLYVYAEDFAALDALYSEFIANGATFSYDITRQDFDWGQWKQFCVLDPDGYGIAFGAANRNADK